MTAMIPQCGLLSGLPPCWRCTLPLGHGGAHLFTAWESARNADKRVPGDRVPLGWRK